jgi:hypothetical protein
MTSQLAAVRVLELLLVLHDARARCRHPRFRGEILRTMNPMIYSAAWEIRHAAQVLGFGPAVSADALRRARCLTNHLHQLQIRLTHDHQLREFDAVCADAARLVAALAQGDWSALAREEEPVDQRSLPVRLAKELLPACVFLATAAALPYLPGVPDTGPTITSVQVGLAVAAALSLIPIDPANREHLLAAVTHATRRTP